MPREIKHNNMDVWSTLKIYQKHDFYNYFYKGFQIDFIVETTMR